MLVVKIFSHRTCGDDKMGHLLCVRSLEADLHAVDRVAGGGEIKRGIGGAGKAGSRGGQHLPYARRIAWRDELWQIKRRVLIRRQEALAMVWNIGRSRATCRRQWEQAAAIVRRGRRALVSLHHANGGKAPGCEGE